MSLKEKLTQFAEKIIDDSLEKGEKAVSFQDKCDAFRAVTAYYAILAKHKVDPPSADENPTFEAFRETLHREGQEPENGGTKVHLSRGLRGSPGSVGGPNPRPFS